MGKLLTGGAELAMDQAARTYFTGHPAHGRLAQFLATEARKAFGDAARLRVEIYRDHESGDLTPQIMVDAGLSYDETWKLIDALLSRLDESEELPEPDAFVAIFPEDHLLKP